MLLVEFEPDQQLEKAVQCALVCAPVACEASLHCARMAIALREFLRMAYANGWNGKTSSPPTFRFGDKVKKRNGAEWHGVVVGRYRTHMTPEGYAVESAFEPGSVQIYPAHALEPWNPEQTASGQLEKQRRMESEMATLFAYLDDTRDKWGENNGGSAC